MCRSNSSASRASNTSSCSESGSSAARAARKTGSQAIRRTITSRTVTRASLRRLDGSSGLKRSMLGQCGNRDRTPLLGSFEYTIDEVHDMVNRGMSVTASPVPTVKNPTPELILRSARRTRRNRHSSP